MPDLTDYSACPTCGKPYDPPPACACGHSEVSHDLSPKKRRTACSVVTGPDWTPCGCREYREVQRPARTTATYEITVYAYGLTVPQLDALFTRIAEAAHALDEEVSVSGGPPGGGV